MKNKLKILLCLGVIIFCAVITPFLSIPVYAKYIKVNPKDNQYIIFTQQNIKTEDMRKKSKLDIDTLEEYMKKFPNLSGIEDTLIDIQDEYNVNALLVLAIARLESGNGKSKIAQSKNNLGGITTLNKSNKSIRAYKSFDSKTDCIIYMAKLLSENYLTDGGKYFNGYTLDDIAKKYSTSSDIWSGLVEDLIYEIQIGLSEI